MEMQGAALLIMVLGGIILFFYFPVFRSHQPLDHSIVFRCAGWIIRAGVHANPEGSAPRRGGLTHYGYQGRIADFLERPGNALPGGW